MKSSHLSSGAPLRALALLALTAVGSAGHAADRRGIPLKRKLVSDKIACAIDVRPPNPAPGSTVEVTVSLAEVLDPPDPQFGTRRPIDDADMIITLVAAPAETAPQKGKGKAKPAATAKPWADARVAHKLKDAGAYGATFTAPAEGVYGVHLGGIAGAAGTLTFATTMGYGIAAPAEDTPAPPLPANAPAATVGNLPNGKLLCEAHCKKDLPEAAPQGGTPAFLESDYAARFDDGQLLQNLLGPATQKLSELEQVDVLAYLHSLQVHPRELFPEAAAYLVGDFTINSHGLERLKESAGIELQEADKKGTVLVVYKGEGGKAPLRRIPVANRVDRDRLDRKNRLGYVVFFELAGDKKAKELVVALGPEPTYPIMKVIARDAQNQRDAGFNKDLQALVGLGKFNDPKSLDKAPKPLKAKLLPVYLRAAELATAYYSDEREFTAFDDEF